MEVSKKNEFVEIKFTGYSNGAVFDSNIEEEVKKLNPEGKVMPMVIAVGQGMVIPGFDRAIEGKEIGKQYEIDIAPKDGFGMRDRSLIKTIPLKVFSEKNINPQAGMVLTMDNSVAKIVAVSGARVITDFNNPLAGKDLKYKFTIVKKVTDENEKARSLLSFNLGFVPDFEIKEDVIVKGPGILKPYVETIKDKFKELMGKNIRFEMIEYKKGENKETVENKTNESK